MVSPIIAPLCIAVMIALMTPNVCANPLFSKVFDSQKTSDSSIYAASVVTQDKTGIRWDLSGAYGTINTNNPIGNQMSLDTLTRVNQLSEVVVCLAALKLNKDNALSLDNPLSTEFTPQSATFTHPDTAKTLTVNMLMTHTSLLNEVGFSTFFQITTLGTPPTGAIDFTRFILSYFFQTVNGVVTLKTTIWTNVAAGSAHRYSYSRANIALLAFYLDRFIARNTPSGATNLDTYIQRAIFGPMGIQDSFFQSEDGSYPSNVGTSERRLSDLSAPGTAPSVFVHPAKYVDVMFYSTPLDISRLSRELFLNTQSTFFSLGTSMKKPTDISASTATTGFTIRTSQTLQGLGIYYFSAVDMCNLALSSKLITACPLKSDTQVWGYISAERTTVTGFFCTDLFVTNPVCVTTFHVYFTAAIPKSANLALAMAAVAIQEAVGDKASVIVTNTDGSSDRLYGLWVFFGVVGTITFVLLAAYFTEYIIQPAPMAGGIPSVTGGKPEGM